MRFNLRFPVSAIEMEYTEVLRGISADAGVSMRTLDKALWQHSKVKQKG